MAVTIDITFPAGQEGAGRFELEERLEDFFGSAAELVGSGVGAAGSDLSFELADREDAEVWIARLCDFLRAAGVRRGAWLAVFPDGWDPEKEWRRIEVFEPKTS
ncbi:MAG TPA: hypothetical protein VH643_20210 [Gemmataceae bacterium]|jgi:hypothetical protein